MIPYNILLSSQNYKRRGLFLKEPVYRQKTTPYAADKMVAGYDQPQLLADLSV
jgi:hypothetical protein